jgi:hypothetical protein
VELVVSDINLTAHSCSKTLGEVSEVDVAILVGIEYIFHERSDFILSDIDFVRQKVGFKVFVGNETIAIFVKCAEAVIHLVLSIEALIFNLAHDST